MTDRANTSTRFYKLVNNMGCWGVGWEVLLPLVQVLAADPGHEVLVLWHPRHTESSQEAHQSTFSFWCTSHHFRQQASQLELLELIFIPDV